MRNCLSDLQPKGVDDGGRVGGGHEGRYGSWQMDTLAHKTDGKQRF